MESFPETEANSFDCWSCNPITPRPHVLKAGALHEESPLQILQHLSIKIKINGKSVVSVIPYSPLLVLPPKVQYGPRARGYSQ